jgi:RNA polymerase sporulation-specific sigma factor
MQINFLTDEELAKVVKVELSSKSDSQALEELLHRYAKVITSIVSKYYVKGEGEEDISQEARLALINAVKSFNGESSFKNYASKCIKNRVLTLIKKANRLKNLPLCDYVPLAGYSDGEDADKNKILPCVKSSPEDHFIERESANELLIKIKQVLSKYEYEVFSLYLNGYSYEDIKKDLGVETKSIDNAIQRARKKLEFIKR